LLYSRTLSRGSNPVRWVQNPVVADSILKMHMITSAIGSIGSLFPYCKAMGIVTKSDLSVTEHSSMHDYIHAMGALLGNTRSCNRKFVSNSISRSDVCLAAMCIMATGAMKAGVQLDDDQSSCSKTTARALKFTVQEVTAMPDNVMVWMRTYNENRCRIREWIKSRLTNAAKPRQFSVLEHLMVSHRDWSEV